MRRFIIILIICIILAIIVGIIFAILTSDKTGKAPTLKNTFPISLFYPDSQIGISAGSGGGPDNLFGQEYAETESESDLSNLISFSNEEIYGYWISSSTAYFLTKEGELKKNDGTGEFSLLSYSSYGMPLLVKQNKTGTAAVVKFDSGGTYIYQTDRNAWELLGDAITDFAFSPDGTKILALEERGSETTLVQYEPFVSQKKTTIILKFSGVDFRVQWPSANRAILTSVSSYFADGAVWAVNLQSKTFSKILTGSGMTALTSVLDSHMLLFRPETKSKTTASLYSADGKKVSEYSRMLLDAKCGVSLSATSAFCGAPKLLQSGTFTFPDDYLKRKVFTHDELIRISLTDGELITIPFSSDSYVDISQVTHVGNAVYFVNRLDDILYRMEVNI